MMMDLNDLLECFGVAAPAVPVSGLSLDSRTLTIGDVFFALAGTSGHGMQYADQAVANGAAAIVFEPHPDLDVDTGKWPISAIEFPDLSRMLGEIASRFFGEPSQDLDIIGITGTNGKTSCVHLLAQMLARRGRAVGTVGTLGIGPLGAEVYSGYTTPDPITLQRALADMRDDGITHVVMEVSSHALAQHRIAGTRLTTVAVTNVSRDHLDYHLDLEQYAQTKSRLVGWGGLKGAILNADDARVAAMADRARTSVTTFGVQRGDIRANNIQMSTGGMSFDLSFPTDQVPVRTAMLGRFNVYNLLTVASVLYTRAWSVKAIADGLSLSQPVLGRLNPYRREGQPVAVIDYAHTPDALDQVLAALHDHGFDSVVCVFGCGGDRDRGKRPLMGAIAERQAERVIITDDNPRTESGDEIVAEIVAGLRDPDNVTVIRDREQAIATALAEAGASDVVLIAGKGHETFQEIDGKRHEFSDARVVSKYLELDRCA